MRTTPIVDIIIAPNRQRQEFDPESLMELTNSIAELGLLHAPVVRETPEGLILVAGERRLKAIQDLWALGQPLVYNLTHIMEGQVPYTTLGELTELEAEEAELDENLKRRDLSWKELASAHERLHNLRVKQHEQAVAGTLDRAIHGEGKEDTWTVSDTAEELTGRRDGAYREGVRRELIVAKHLDNPAVASAKTVDDAFKILKRQETAAKNVALAEEVGKTFNSDTHEILNDNCLAWMWDEQEAIAAGKEPIIDVILTDPPYGMGAHSFGDGAGRMSGIEHHYDDSKESWLKLMQDWSVLSYTITKPRAHAYVFCDLDNFHELKALMERAGWYVFRTPLIYVKVGSGRVPLPDLGPRRQYEIILYAIKGKKTTNCIYPDVINGTSYESFGHGAQKSVEVYTNLLRRSCNSGDVILDSFGGTGTLIPAAHSLQCKAIVIEQEKEYFAICVERLKALDADKGAA